jgi:hypothetical protein
MTTPKKPARKAARRAKTPVRKSKTPARKQGAGAMRLAAVDRDAFRDLVEEVWRRNAPPGLIERHDAKQ